MLRRNARSVGGDRITDGTIPNEKAALLASTALASLTSIVQAPEMKVCLSGLNFCKERWKTDKAAIKRALDSASIGPAHDDAADAGVPVLAMTA